MKRPILLLVLIVTVMLAGCSDEPTSDSDPENVGDSIPEDPQTTSPSTPGEGSDETVSMFWENETFTGDYVSTGSMDTESMLIAERTFEVPEGATKAKFSLVLESAAPPDGAVRFIEPGCEEEACWNHTNMSGGTAQATVNAPPAGTWNLVIFAGVPPVSAGTYSLEVAALVPA